MTGIQVFQQGSFNLATSSQGGRITQGGDRNSLSLAFGFNRNTATGQGRVFQQGTGGSDQFTLSAQSQGARVFFSGNGGQDVLNLPAGTLRFGNVFFNPATRSGVFAPGIQRVNFFS
jgi:hypothetical protein